MSLEQRHLSPEQIQKAAPGLFRRLLSLGFTAVEQSIDAFSMECKQRGNHNASRTKFIKDKEVDKKYDIEIALVPTDTGDCKIEYRYQFYDRPSAGYLKLTQTLDTFNPLTAIKKIVES